MESKHHEFLTESLDKISPLYPRKKNHYKLRSSVGEPQGRSRRCSEEKDRASPELNLEFPTYSIVGTDFLLN